MVVKTNILSDLNQQQKEAVVYTQGASIILAGAGSGKTRALTSKVIYLMKEKKVDPRAIVMVTFTNKAAKEMKQRVGHDLGFVGTFHSFCVRILRRYASRIGYDNHFIIYDDKDKTVLLKKIIKQYPSPTGVKIHYSSLSNKIS